MEVKINPKVKDVLKILGVTALVAGVVIAPPITMLIGALIKGEQEEARKRSFKEWERFNIVRLRQLLKRMEKQKIINIEPIKNGAKISLTEKGRTKVLCYKLEQMALNKPQRWDRKWRVIIYDVPKEKRFQQSNFRRMLQKLMFLKIQNSVYLTPYRCDKEIEFLRQYFEIPENIIYMVVQRIENDLVYKKYFGLT